MNTSEKTACICILDVESKYLDSYSSWMFTFMRDTFFQDRFDVYIATVNIEKFEASELNKFLLAAQETGKIVNIFPIQFNLQEKITKFKLLEMASFCENFREVNQGLHNLKYTWFYQLTSNVPFGKFITNSFDSLFSRRMFLDKNAAYLIEHNFDAPHYSFFMTGDRFVFSNLQNLISYVKAKHNLSDTPQDIIFYMRKLMYRQNTDYIMIEKVI